MPSTFADVAGADEAVEELDEIRTSCRTRPATRRSAPRSQGACCSTVRPAQVRRCSRGRRR